MFRRRRNSQKPDEQLYAAFKQNFCALGSAPLSIGRAPTQPHSSLADVLTDADLPNRYASTTPTSSPSLELLLPTTGATSPCLTPPSDHLRAHGDMKESNVDIAEKRPTNDTRFDLLTSDDFFRRLDHLDDTNDHDGSLKDFNDHYQLTPSLMDPGSFAFSPFSSQLAGYCTPPAGGVSTLSSTTMPQHDHGLSTNDGHPAMHPYQTPMLQSHNFENLCHLAPQQVFLPSNLLQHRDSGYEAMSQSPQQPSPSKSDTKMRPPATGRSIAQDLEDGGSASPRPTIGQQYVSSPLIILFDAA
jgi:hypothetical protein